MATLLVLAAGMASRYGSLKQIDQFGPSGERIIDYSVYDAIGAGFTKVVFVIRRQFAEEFREIFGPVSGGKIRTDYVYQEPDSFTMGHPVPEARTKPWGTAHAVLCAANAVNEPFAVINADDFYGRDAFHKAYRFLSTEATHRHWANICYQLSNTLSDHGSVSRGVCATDDHHRILSTTERVKVFRSNSRIVYEDQDGLHPLDGQARVSMNFWCFTPAVFPLAQGLFDRFLKEHDGNLKSEFFITQVGDAFIHQQKGQLSAITTDAQWFGVTYQEDKPAVQTCIHDLVATGLYPPALW